MKNNDNKLLLLLSVFEGGESFELKKGTVKNELEMKTTSAHRRRKPFELRMR